MSVIGTGGSARKSLFFNIFTPIFAYFLHFTIFSMLNKKLSFKLKQKLLVQRLLKRCLLDMLHWFFPAIPGVITGRVK